MHHSILLALLQCIIYFLNLLETKCMQNLQDELVEKDSIISELKKDCLKKDAVLEYLSKEKDIVQKNSCVMEDTLNDTLMRLNEAAEIYKKQYLEIEKLKKKLEKKSNRKERQLSESLSVKDELSSSVEIKGGLFAEGIQLPQNRSSDSDTGEHVLGNNLEAKKNMIETGPLEHERCLQGNTSSKVKLLENIYPPFIRESFERKYPASSNDHIKSLMKRVKSSFLADIPLYEPSSASRQSPELQSMIDQNLAKLSLSKSKEEDEVPYSIPCPVFDADEIQYSIPCPVCDTDIGIYASSSEEMVNHLEMQHKQQMCPVCGKLFDMTLPQKYFQFHVEDHFIQGVKK